MGGTTAVAAKKTSAQQAAQEPARPQAKAASGGKGAPFAKGRAALEPGRQPGYDQQLKSLMPAPRKGEPITATTSSPGEISFLGTNTARHGRDPDPTQPEADYTDTTFRPVTSATQPGDNLDLDEHFPPGGTVEVVTGPGATRRMPSEEARPKSGQTTVLRLPTGEYHMVADRGSSAGKATWWPEPITRAEVRKLHPDSSERFITAMVDTNVAMNAYLVKRALAGVRPGLAANEFSALARWKLINMLTVTALEIGGAHAFEDPTDLSTYVGMADYALENLRTHARLR